MNPKVFESTKKMKNVYDLSEKEGMVNKKIIFLAAFFILSFAF